MAICDACKAIPADLFSSASNTQCSLILHPSFDDLVTSADAGCQLCVIFLDAVQKRAQDGELVNIWGKPIDGSKEVQLRSTKFSQQWVCVDNADCGNFRGLPIPSGWDDGALSDAAPTLDTRSSLEHQAATLKWWMQNCADNHDECVGSQDSSYIPTRVIDVESDSPDTVRLVATDGLSIADKRYIAASHCWGLTMPDSAKTVTSNLEAHLQFIPLGALTKTFVDIIHIARSIDVRYVWIDSLCIIQDSYEDWEVEASMMASVYSNAYVTIAASGSADGSGGCKLGDPHDIPLGPVDLVCDELSENLEANTHKIRIFSQPKQQMVNTLLQDPLIKRGWTLQERELSPKVAHYSIDTLRWECKSLKASLQYPWGDSVVTSGERVLDEGRLVKQKPDIKNGYFSDAQIRKNGNAWFNVVGRYTRRSLTKQADILPAISGIARHFAKVTGDSYHAGIFESHGAISLLWEVAGEWKKEYEKSTRPNEYLGPTWSWASVKGRVEWTWNLQQVKSEALDPLFTARIVRFNTTPALHDLYGRVKDGSLRIRGLMVPAVATWKSEDGLRADQRSIFCLDRPGSKVGTIKFDVPSEASSFIFCLACMKDNEHNWIHALGLVATGVNALEFKRVGVVSTKEAFWWDKAKTVEIIIV